MDGQRNDFPTRDTSLVGTAGVHHVVSQLSLRGLIALPTIRNTAGVDVLVSNTEGTWHANLQVKTSRSKVSFWPVGANWSSWTGPSNFYVFLRYNAETKGFEVLLETSGKVAANVAKGTEEERRKGLKKWAPCFHLKGEYERLKQKWERFGPAAQQPQQSKRLIRDVRSSGKGLK